MILHSLLGCMLLVSLNAKSLTTKDACEENKVSFFVTDNSILKSEDSIVYKDTSEEDCLKICSRNRDQFNVPIVCNSFTYDHASFSCTIHKEKTAPVGSEVLESTVGKRYFEKICLSHNVPAHCMQSQFIRVDQSVLVGYAVNMTLTDSLESCVAQCVQETDCKSAMYFYEDGECITNQESAMSKPLRFTKEENDKVVYFQNGCSKNGEEVKNEEDVEDVPEGSVSSEAAPVEEEVKPKVNIQISETTPAPVTKVTKEEKTTTSVETNNESESDGEEYVDEETSEEVEEKEEEPTTTTVATTTTEATTEAPVTEEFIETTTSRRVKSQLTKKIKKHPKNFGSKTYEILKNESIVKKTKTEIPISDEENEIPKSVEIEENYFSEWSDWTPCTKSQERQIRRRRCLNMRKCLGALMQVQNCPDVLPTTTPENRESIRSVVSVDGDEYDEPIAVENVPMNLLPSHLQPITNEQVWGQWQGSCQQFASSQPCNNGNMIGFESRECIAKDPAQCEGPFFRYCTLAC